MEAGSRPVQRSGAANGVTIESPAMSDFVAGEAVCLANIPTGVASVPELRFAAGEKTFRQCLANVPRVTASKRALSNGWSEGVVGSPAMWAA